LRCLEHLCLRTQAPLSDGWGDAPTLNIFSADLDKQGVGTETQNKGKLNRQTLHMRQAPFTDKALEP
jgi:hypothetical protein